MRHISAKLNMYIMSISALNNNIEKSVLNFIVWSFVVLTFSYIFILGTMVKNIVERQSLEASVRTLSSEVGDLELAYLSMSNNINLPLSYSLGFKDAKATFATRKPLGLLPVGGKNIQNDI